MTARKWISDLPLPVAGQPWPPSPSRLAEIKDRVQAAGPGPWTRRGRYVPADIVDAEGYYVGQIDNGADADFIAHARQDIDDLLAEVRRLKSVLRDAVDQIAELEADLGEATARVADVEAEREKLIRWHREDGKELARLLSHVAELQENLRAVNAGWSVARARIAELEKAVAS